MENKFIQNYRVKVVLDDKGNYQQTFLCDVPLDEAIKLLKKQAKCNSEKKSLLEKIKSYYAVFAKAIAKKRSMEEKIIQLDQENMHLRQQLKYYKSICEGEDLFTH